MFAITFCLMLGCSGPQPIDPTAPAPLPPIMVEPPDRPDRLPDLPPDPAMTITIGREKSDLTMTTWLNVDVRFWYDSQPQVVTNKKWTSTVSRDRLQASTEMTKDYRIEVVRTEKPSIVLMHDSDGNIVIRICVPKDWNVIMKK